MQHFEKIIIYNCVSCVLIENPTVNATEQSNSDGDVSNNLLTEALNNDILLLGDDLPTAFGWEWLIKNSGRNK